MLGVVLAGAAWLTAAWLLLETVVPAKLELPAIDTDQVFGAEAVREAKRYEQFLLILWLLSTLALLGTLAVYARYGVAYVRESAAGRIGTGMLLGMLGLAIVWLVQLPFGLAGHWWDRRHDLTDAGYLEWALDNWIILTAEFLFICFALLVVMAIAGPLGNYWWLPGAAVFIGLATLFTAITPYLAVDDEPLRDPDLVATAREYERLQGVDEIPVRVEYVSDLTDQINAYATGLGPTRRIFLWDTLLDGRLADDEVKVVLAHEIGHHSSDHLTKGLTWYALFALPGTFLLMLATRRRGGMRQPEAVPLSLFVLVALSLAAAPAQNWITRRMETEADWKALETTRDAPAARGLFLAFSETSLSNPEPPTWAYLFLSTHPTLAQRIAMVDAWQAAR